MSTSYVCDSIWWKNVSRHLLCDDDEDAFNEVRLLQSRAVPLGELYNKLIQNQKGTISLHDKGVVEEEEDSVLMSLLCEPRLVASLKMRIDISIQEFVYELDRVCVELGGIDDFVGNMGYTSWVAHRNEIIWNMCVLMHDTDKTSTDVIEMLMLKKKSITTQAVNEYKDCLRESLKGIRALLRISECKHDFLDRYQENCNDASNVCASPPLVFLLQMKARGVSFQLLKSCFGVETFQLSLIHYADMAKVFFTGYSSHFIAVCITTISTITTLLRTAEDSSAWHGIQLDNEVRQHNVLRVCVKVPALSLTHYASTGHITLLKQENVHDVVCGLRTVRLLTCLHKLSIRGFFTPGMISVEHLLPHIARLRSKERITTASLIERVLIPVGERAGLPYKDGLYSECTSFELLTPPTADLREGCRHTMMNTISEDSNEAQVKIPHIPLALHEHYTIIQKILQIIEMQSLYSIIFLKDIRSLLLQTARHSKSRCLLSSRLKQVIPVVVKKCIDRCTIALEAKKEDLHHVLYKSGCVATVAPSSAHIACCCRVTCCFLLCACFAFSVCFEWVVKLPLQVMPCRSAVNIVTLCDFPLLLVAARGSFIELTEKGNTIFKDMLKSIITSMQNDHLFINKWLASSSTRNKTKKRCLLPTQ